jgi:predicted nuclease of predicted toxin-antitoxin system
VIPRFLLDEHVWHGLIGVGRELGLDIVPAQRVLPPGTQDAEVLAYAAAEGRILLTGNARDFAPLAIEWFLAGREHAGIVIVPGQTDRSFLSKALRTIGHNYTAEAFRNTYRFMQEFA